MFFKKTKLEVFNDELERLHGQLNALSWESIEDPHAKDCYLEILKQIKFITDQVISNSEDTNVRKR